jgi:hypothetical protein
MSSYASRRYIEALHSELDRLETTATLYSELIELLYRWAQRRGAPVPVPALTPLMTFQQVRELVLEPLREQVDREDPVP